MLNYNRGILYSKAICDFLADRGDLRDYEICIETFNNCRESGYYLTVYYNGETEQEYPILFWIHEHRNGDSCVVRWGTRKDFEAGETNFNNMYSEKIYREQTACFDVFNPYEIADFIAEKIKAHFNGQE